MPAPIVCDKLVDVGTVLLDPTFQQLLIEGDQAVAALVRSELTANGKTDPVIVAAVAHSDEDILENLDRFGRVGPEVYGIVAAFDPTDGFGIIGTT